LDDDVTVERSDTVRVIRPDYPQIGEHLRTARRARRLSLRVLADRLGVSPSLISQIERGRANPSVSTLYSLVAELDVSLDELLFNDRRPSTRGAAVSEGGADEPRPSPVLRSADRQRIRLASGVIWERLTTISEPGVEFLFVIYEVGGASSPAGSFQRHPGHEWGHVVSGELEVRIGFDTYVMEPGDAISFDSTLPHRLANRGDVPVHAIWFVLGRVPLEPEHLHDDPLRAGDGLIGDRRDE
jgi:transcriptional regulator with XRE-family HTH domain